MNKAIVSRSLHKWLALLIGLQLLIWLASGLYMVVVDLDFIHGDPLVKNTAQELSLPASSVVSVNELHRRYAGATEIGLLSLMGEPFFTVTTESNRYLIDPRDGAIVSPLNKNAAREIAVFHFNGDDPIRRIELLTEQPPAEIGKRPLPIWRVDFDDRFNTSFYIDPYTGALVTRRHQYWRIFDFFFMLHIMDYDDRTDAHNLLLKIAQFAGVSFAITGLWLLFYSFSRRRKTLPK